MKTHFPSKFSFSGSDKLDFVRDIVRGSRQLKGKKVSLFSFPEFSAWIELIFSACNANLVTDCLSFIKSTYWLKNEGVSF